VKNQTHSYQGNIKNRKKSLEETRKNKRSCEGGVSHLCLKAFNKTGKNGQNKLIGRETTTSALRVKPQNSDVQEKKIRIAVFTTKRAERAEGGEKRTHKSHK